MAAQEMPGWLLKLRSLPHHLRMPATASLYPNLTADERSILAHDWPTWARPEQIAPDWQWETWLILAGRGWGKSRTGAEWANEQALHVPIIHLIAPTAADHRDVMVEGPAGILAVSHPDRRPIYEPSKRRLTWPNGAIGLLFSADEPERLRGPQCHKAWCDEVAAWRYLDAAWDNLQFGLRLGDHPQAAITTTPRPLTLIKSLLNDPATAVTRGSTFDNAANLAPSALAKLRRKYEGTRLGRQELYAEILDDFPGAIVARAMIDAGRLTDEPERQRCVVGVDPAVTAEEGSDETGIVVDARGVDGLGYVLADLSCRMGPNDWARRAIRAYHDYQADLIVAEANQGGDMVKTIIHGIDPNVPVKLVRATKGKHVRFEPVGALYEQGRIKHVGSFPQLEDQVCAFTPAGYEGAGSPDRADAHVWAMTELFLERQFQVRGHR